MEDKCKLMRPKAPECEGQVGDKCKIMRPKAPRVGDKCGRRVGDKCKLWETSVNSCGPRHPEWETSVGNKCGKQGGDKCKLMRPKAPRVRDKVWETRGRQL